MGKLESAERAKKFGLIALLIIIIQLIATQSVFHLHKRILTVFVVQFFYWFVPFFIVYIVEERGIKSLGITLKWEKSVSYLLYTVLGIILSTVVFALSVYLRIHLAKENMEGLFSLRFNILQAIFIQIIGVGVPEELFFRGYLMTRFCNWLGDTRGLLLNGFIFGIGHIIHRISLHGFDYTFPAILIGVDTFIAALVFGYIYLKTKSLLPCALTHIFSNTFGVQIIQMLKSLLI